MFYWYGASFGHCNITMADFYLTLPSNSSTTYFPENKVNNFVTTLPKHIQLEGRWQVALVEIQFPFNFYTLNAGDEIIIVSLYENADEKIEIAINKGYYTNPSILTTKINKRIDRIIGENRIKFEYDSLINRVRVTTVDCALWLSETLRQIMGFSQSSVNNISANQTYWDIEAFNLNTSIAPYSTDMNHDIHSIYVYCDIVDRGIVGDTLVPLLRVVPTHARHGDVVHITFSNHHYIPVHSKNFETIRIYLSDDTGKLIAFDGGHCVATLHFRRDPL